MARASVLLTVLAFVACGGGDDAPVAGTPVAGGLGAVDSAAAVQPADSTQADAAQGETELVRETFAYSGAGRDPFLSLILSGAVKPEPADLLIVGIAYDSRYPQRSVVTLRDRSDGQRYTVQSGDQIGRVRVQTIREREVVLIIEEFGLERQMVLSLARRTQEVNQ